MPDELNLVQKADGLAQEAFRALLAEGRPLSFRELAERLEVDHASMANALKALCLGGRAEMDDERRLLGIFGLTLKPTSHRMELRGTTFFTWCAFDSVGIPAALQESAEITSECGHCQREIHLTVVAGAPPSAPAVISWSPQQCDSIREEFCPTVNFYCDDGHFAESTTHGQASGAFLTLEGAAALGANIWAWAAERR